MLIRVVSGLVLAPPALLLVYWGGMPFAIAMAVVAALAFHEWLRIVTGQAQPAAFGALAAVVLANLLESVSVALGAILVSTLVLGLILTLRRTANPWLAAFGLPYVGLAAILLPWLRAQGDSGQGDMGLFLAVFALLAVWASDIGAYAAGRIIGGPKLAPRISPNKTWAGLGGAIVTAGIVGAATAMGFHIAQALVFGAVAGILAVIGQGGDLFESSIKRRFGVKDSGELIPGHGGMLDRIDALLAVVPVFAALYALGLSAGFLS